MIIFICYCNKTCKIVPDGGRIRWKRGGDGERRARGRRHRAVGLAPPAPLHRTQLRQGTTHHATPHHTTPHTTQGFTHNYTTPHHSHNTAPLTQQRPAPLTQHRAIHIKSHCTTNTTLYRVFVVHNIALLTHHTALHYRMTTWHYTIPYYNTWHLKSALGEGSPNTTPLIRLSQRLTTTSKVAP